jgi:hypothetical protein
MDVNIELVKAVRRGVKLLDKKVPHWRKVMAKYREQFNFHDSDHCIVGTLSHHTAALRLKANEEAFSAGVRKLTEGEPLVGSTLFARAGHYAGHYGFNIGAARDVDSATQMSALQALWEAELDA